MATTQISLPHQFCIAECDAMWHGISLWSLWISYSGHLPSQTVVPTSCSLGVGQSELTEKVLMLLKHCEATARTLVCNQHFGHKSKKKHHTDCYEES